MAPPYQSAHQEDESEWEHRRLGQVPQTQDEAERDEPRPTRIPCCSQKERGGQIDQRRH